MNKQMKGYEGDTTVTYNSDKPNEVEISVRASGYLKKVVVYKNGKMDLIYDNMFLGGNINKEFDNDTKYTYEYLTSSKFRQTDNSIHTALYEIFNSKGVDTVDD